MSDSPRDPQLEHVLEALKENVHESLFAAMPGTILSYNASMRSATVQGSLQRAHYDETGTRISQALPVFNDVPVVFPGTAQMRIKFPLVSGDPVLLIFCGQSLNAWKSQGGLVDDADDRRHDPSDVVAIPGLVDFGHASEAAAMIEFTSTTVEIGGTDKLVTKSDFDSHTHTSGGSGSPTSAPIVPATGTSVLRG